VGFALTTDQPPEGREERYEIIDGKQVWPRPGEPDDGRLYEVVNGQRKEVPRMGAFAATIATFLAAHLNLFAWQHRLGFAVVEVLFQLAPGRPQRRPDVAYIPYSRWQGLPQPLQDPAAWDVIPSLAVEIVSPTNTAEDIEDKLQDYFGAGVQLVWVIYPLRRRAYVYESLTQVHIRTDNDELDGGAVLPGFRLRIADLFVALVPPSQP
jgi:Uma2 family endonuclease